jgi:hypothetical protein
VFESNNIDKGWDGKYKNQLQSTGVYVYIVTTNNLAGKKVTTKGTFALIR